MEETSSIFNSAFGENIVETSLTAVKNGLNDVSGLANCIEISTTTYPKNDPNLLKSLKMLNGKTLYDYQIDAICAIRQREESDENGTILRLPVGSGKSLIFETLALAFPTVKPKPICIGCPPSFPLSNQVTIDDYPFFCERPYFDKEHDRCAMLLKKYRQNEVTIIITHDHLLQQLVRYFYTDYPAIYAHDKKSKIPIISAGYTIEQINYKSKIWILPGNKRNMDDLHKMSRSAPFMRIIIDDYTSMPEIASFRQIYASSTLWVSGTGWNRPPDQIPISYYTLQGFDTDKITLVDTSSRPLQGLARSNIYSCNVKTTTTSFDTYEFVGELESLCKRTYGCYPGDLYPPIRQNAILQNYFKLAWLLGNKSSIGSVLNAFEADLRLGSIDASEFKYLTELRSHLETSAPQLFDLLKDAGAKHSAKDCTNLVPPSNCAVCNSPAETHKGYGLVANCCGAFICSKCISQASSLFKDEHYCTCCQTKNPTYIVNTTKYKDDSRISIRAGCIDKVINNDIQTDIEFAAYSIVRGLVPKESLGPIPRHLDASGMPFKLIAKTQMGLMALQYSVEALIKTKAPTTKNSFILLYGAPPSQQNRIIQFYNKVLSVKFKRGTAPTLMFKGGMADLIGLHQNIPVIIKWIQVPYRDELEQLVGRIVRISDFENPLYIFVDLDPEN